MDIFSAKLRIGYGYALASSLMLFLSFPEINFYLFAWIALVPLLYYLYDCDKQTAFKIGFFFGLFYFYSTTYWIYHSINKYGNIPLIPSLLIVFILCMFLSLFPAFFSLLYSSYIRKADLPVAFVAPVLWTTLEFVRSYAFTGFPWSSLGYSQYKFLPLIQVADIIGIYGISFLIVAVNGALADILLIKRRYIERPLASFLPIVSGFVVLTIAVIFVFGYGFFRIYQHREGHNIKVAVIQGNIEQDKKWDPVYQQSVMSAYTELSLSILNNGPDITIWPETSVPFHFGKDRELTDRLIAFQQQLNSYLLFGSAMIKPPKSGQAGYTNSAVLLDKNGNITYLYDKIHLVPFGEYVPLRSLLFFINKLTAGSGDFTSGDSYIKAITPFGSFGTVICYEIIFPGMVRKFFVKGGDFLVTITNDAWFGKTYGPYQHFSMAVFRAVENRKPVVRAANTGISGFIDSSGRILDKTDIFKRTALVRDLKTDKTLSPYTKYGDIFSYLCIVCSLLLFIMKRK